MLYYYTMPCMIGEVTTAGFSSTRSIELPVKKNKTIMGKKNGNFVPADHTFSEEFLICDKCEIIA